VLLQRQWEGSRIPVTIDIGFGVAMADPAQLLD
jgi:hypothetical protein